MADLSLDEIIANKKGSNFKVQFTNTNVRKQFQGKGNQRLNFRPGSLFKSNRLGIAQQKRPFSAPGLKTKPTFQGTPQVQGNNGTVLSGPGKGQIDARDMISIKNRIKIPDARTKIVQKRINKRMLDARSNIQGGGQLPGTVQPSGFGVGVQQQQQPVLQRPPQPGRPAGQQRFQSPQGFQFQQPRQVNPQHNQQMQFSQKPQFRQQRPQGPQFNPRQPQPFNQQPQSQMMNQAPINFNQTRQGFSGQQSSNFGQPPRPFQQVSDQSNSGQLVNFTVSLNSGQPSAQPVGTLTRTLMNPLAGGGALVEDTGSSLKITRSIPDVTFDGQNLTVTRRVPKGAQERPLPFSGGGPKKPMMDNSRGPVIQIRNDHFKPKPIQAPAPAQTNIIRMRPAINQRKRAPSPIQAPFFNTNAAKQPPPPRQAPIRQAPAPAPAPSPPPSYATNTRYKTVKNAPVSSPPVRSRQPPAPSPLAQSRLKPPLNAPVSRLPPQQPQRSAFSRIQLDTEHSAMSTRLSAPGLSATKRLAPHPSTQPQQPVAMAKATAPDKMAMKRRAPMSLSERFAPLGGAGNPIPVITDQMPVKKRRMLEPEPEHEKDEYEADFDMKTLLPEQEEEEEEEVEPGATLLSPLQGFRILVSNLHASVTQDDIIELFGAIGPLKKANLLTRGQAEVAFIHKEHAVMALKKYHNRELDGQPMFVKLTTPLNAKVMKVPAEEDSPSSLPASLRSSKKAPTPSAAPVEIPLIHKALFKTGDTAPSKSVRFTVKL